MINLLFRLFLAFNSTSLIIVVYIIKSEAEFYWIPRCVLEIPSYIYYIFFIILLIASTYLSLIISNLLSKDEIKPGVITSIESANNSFLPSYLGYFFVALDVPNNETLYFVYTIIYVFTFFSQTLYFNPIFLIFGYHFYNLTDINQVRIFLITKKKLKTLASAEFPVLQRINDYTFIDKT